MDTSQLPYPKQPMNSNLARSLRYYQKGALNPEAWFSIVEDDYTKILGAVNWDSLFPEHNSDYQVLDIGCGTGRFPMMLQARLPSTICLHYDYLDPSRYCLSTCNQSLHQPFLPRNAWQTTWEHAENVLAPGSYDVAWAIQSLYCLDHASLHASLSRLIGALHPFRGTACIVLAKQEAFFSQAHQTFFQEFSPHAPMPYLSAESVVAGLEKLGAISTIREVACTHSISIRHDRLLEQYLQQSVMDSTPLPIWIQQPRLRQLLESYRHGDTYHFTNPYWLILCTPPSAGTGGKLRLQRYLTSVTSRKLAS
ncbi:MAG: class I SAM-dependent methyltransferase [Nitrospirota bacterium]|nr:class I SAM-dependent methyltransferase [Nitrospirota bacterium]MDH5699852.1 class I SAM-dependent methyltransferase [Nitrospirota bacterium]